MKNVMRLTALFSFALLVFSCTQQSQVSLLETVPADVKSVAVTDLDKLLKEAGCGVSSGKVTFTDDVNALMSHSGIGETEIGMITRFAGSGAVALDEVVMFSDARDRMCLTFHVKDEPTLLSMIDSCGISTGARVEADEYSYYPVQDGFIVVGNGQGWLLERKSHDIVADVKLMLQNAEQASVGKVEWKTRFLENDDMFAALIDVPVSLEAYFGSAEYAATVVGVNADSERDYAVVDVKLYTSEGKRLKINTLLAPINSSFLKYLYPYDIAALAVGVPADVDWHALYETFEPMMSYDTRAALSMMLPYMKSIEGTMSFAFGPVAGAQALNMASVETWEFAMMMPLKPGMAQESYNSIRQLARNYNLPFKEVENAMEYKSGEVTFYLSAVNDCIVFSNREIVERGDTRLSADSFEGKAIALVADVSYKSEIMKAMDIPFGFEFTAWVDDDRLQLRSRLNGASASFLESCIGALAEDINEKNR